MNAIPWYIIRQHRELVLHGGAEPSLDRYVAGPYLDSWDAQQEITRLQSAEQRIYQAIGWIVLGLALVALYAYAMANVGMVRETVELPPCAECTAPQDVTYSDQQPDEVIFHWREGWTCPEPCID